ncbi:hypothetical protein SCHPADRAFT_281394 [Schizopora paradoxa]|uniref:Uncharacterized protein n=1 Tax=Schizopora paradoxa TaxID=27342 RepID=A0A0H2RSY2_9AGAM|nr:hypothetical protein SCHPADRAFT_281394 [Schizopora paradoxa]
MVLKRSLVRMCIVDSLIPDTTLRNVEENSVDCGSALGIRRHFPWASSLSIIFFFVFCESYGWAMRLKLKR